MAATSAPLQLASAAAWPSTWPTGQGGDVLAWWVLVAAVACCALSAVKALFNIGFWVFLALVVLPFAYKYYDKKNNASAAQAAAVAANAAAAAAEADAAPPPLPPPAAATPAPPVEVVPDRWAAAVQRPDVAFPATRFS
jgi:hypothetical protein